MSPPRVRILFADWFLKDKGVDCFNKLSRFFVRRSGLKMTQLTLTPINLSSTIPPMSKRNPRLSRLTSFSRLLLAEWRKLKLPTGEDSVIVAVSGGADSTALLLAVHELKNRQKINTRICAAHLDHGIRETSKKDAKWVAQLAKSLGFESVIGRAKVAEGAAVKSENLEQAARNARYAFLERTAKRRGAQFVLTAHTMDDQAETVLLRLMRGSSGGGLGGMEAVRPIARNSPIMLVRPLLWARRKHTEDYCRMRKADFLHDEMNDDERFARVKVRKQLLPIMQSFNNKIVEALSRTATLLREDGVILLSNSDDLLLKAAEGNSRGREAKVPRLSVNVLSSAPPALRRRALRQWISNGRGGDSRRIEMVHLLAVERLLEGNVGGRKVELPNGSRVYRRRGWLEFEGEND
jgi:tRNA(Ile)-lysidine synthase